jgi:hypothetical protein
MDLGGGGEMGSDTTRIWAQGTSALSLLPFMLRFMVVNMSSVVENRMDRASSSTVPYKIKD